MSWKITPSNLLVDDADALAYLTAVEAADTAAGQSGGLESGVRLAVNAFVKGCKADGIWPAIKASCILAGAKTLSGALVALAGTSPSNENFAPADYDRKTGLKGNGTDKRLVSINNNTLAQNNNHLYINTYEAGAGTSSVILIGTVGSQTGSSCIRRSGANTMQANCMNSSLSVLGTNTGVGGYGVSRSAAGSYLAMFAGGTPASVTATSETPRNEAIGVLAAGASSLTYATHRALFFSVGNAVDLALLHSRVTTLTNAITAAIP